MPVVEIFGVGLEAMHLAFGGAAIIAFIFAGSAGNRAGLREAAPYLGKVLPYVVVAGVIYLGATSFGGLFGLSDRQLAAAVAVLLVGIYVVATSQQELSLPFWLTFIPILLFVAQYLVPNVVAEAFMPVFRLVGIEPRPLDSVQALILAFAAVIAYWAVQYRAGSGPRNADTIASYIFGGTGGRTGALPRLIGRYLTITRLVFGFTFILVTLALGEGGGLAAQAVSLLSEAPVVASNLLAIVMGFLGLGGSVPEWLLWIPGVEPAAAALSNLRPMTFLIVTLIVLALAWGAAERLDIYETRLTKERERRKRLKEEVED